MKDLHKRWLTGSILGLALLPCGCKKEDPQRLAAVGRKIGEKLNTSFRSARDKTLVIRPAAANDNASPEQRVVCRLRWDSALADTTIEVHATGGDVVMSGNVPNAALRQRAIDLALSTKGVEHVNADKLYVSP